MSYSDFKLHQNVELFINKSRTSSRVVKGEIVYISKHFITIQGANSIKESFNYMDFSTGLITIKG